MPRTDDAEELALSRKANAVAGLPMFSAADASEAMARDVDRLDAAIKSVEASATPEETRIVEEIQAHLRGRFRFTSDDVAALLTAHGVPRTGPQAGNIRRRFASRVINSGKGKWWTVVDEMMTKDAVRSGRRVAVWQVIQFPEGS
jgi:hypothetical protein